MMWFVCFVISISFLVLAAIFPAVMNKTLFRKRKISFFHSLFAGAFLGTLLLFLPINMISAEVTILGMWRAFLLSVFHAVQVFTIGCDYAFASESMVGCPGWLGEFYKVWAATLYVVAPVFSFGFILSLFKNLSANLKYMFAFNRPVYAFSELNDKALTLAQDIKKNNKKALIVFSDVFDNNEESAYERIEKAKQLGALCFKKDILVINFKNHSKKKPIWFFTIGKNEAENLNQSLKLIENYADRDHTRIYVFSKKVESELLLTAVDKGKIKVRRVNEVQSLVYRVLYEQGCDLFDSAVDTDDGCKKISAVVVGMGSHGTEMVKALTWYGQMDNYKLEIHAFDKDPLAAEKFTAAAPELMSPDYNGVKMAGEPQYKITVHSGIDVDTITFANEISKIKDATYVIVALGDDDVNIKTAVNLRMYFERSKIHPAIRAIVYNSQQKKALEGIRNYSGQAYDIAFIGDVESSYTEAVIVDSELEEEALNRHLKWGEEEAFWTYEYNYRSSMASAIHRQARIHCAIPGAAKREEELTDTERGVIEVLEHRRWNAYMRAEGYVYSGSKDKSSRNDLAKEHNDLVEFASLPEEEKRKDSQVGTD